MGVEFKRKVKTIVIVCGSESDLPMVKPIVHDFRPERVKIAVHVMSCHRNPREILMFAKELPSNTDAVIAVGGKAFALPGMLDVFLRAEGKYVPVIGVALGNPGSESFEAARLSIEELPDAPVVINEISGKAYAGSDGLSQAISRVINDELPPPKLRTTRLAQMNVYKNFD